MRSDTFVGRVSGEPIPRVPGESWAYARKLRMGAKAAHGREGWAWVRTASVPSEHAVVSTGQASMTAGCCFAGR